MSRQAACDRCLGSGWNNGGVCPHCFGTGIFIPMANRQQARALEELQDARRSGDFVGRQMAVDDTPLSK